MQEGMLSEEREGVCGGVEDKTSRIINEGGRALTPYKKTHIRQSSLQSAMM